MGKDVELIVTTSRQIRQTTVKHYDGMARLVVAALLATTVTALRSYLTLPDGTKVPIKTENDARARNYIVRARAAIESDAIDATLSTQVLPKPGACAGNFTFAGREDDGDVKLHAATVAESITNWAEVVDKLRGTRFEKYLTMDGSVLP